MPSRSLTRLRTLCLALPDAREVESWGTPTFRVKTIFAMYSAAESHHGAGREGVWIKATKVNQALMVQMAPDRFFVPPYVGPSGWIGVYLDPARTDWDELAELLHDAWRMSAPKKLVARHESASDEAAPARPSRAGAGSATKKATKKATRKVSGTVAKKASRPGARKSARASGATARRGSRR